MNIEELESEYSLQEGCIVEVQTLNIGDLCFYRDEEEKATIEHKLLEVVKHYLIGHVVMTTLRDKNKLYADIFG